MQKITTFITFDDCAEEAARFYVSIFKRSKIVKLSRYGEAGPGPVGSVMVVQFVLEGQTFLALNGGPHFKLTDAVSLTVDCKTQREVDGYARKLCAGGGKQGPCGWITDRFGLWWQVVPSMLRDCLADRDADKARRVMEAMLQMKKMNIAKLKKAYRG